jgi:hypothetical protein
MNRDTPNLILRVIGFGILILLVILGPIFKIYGVFSVPFWIALAFCAIFIGWAYAIYKKIYASKRISDSQEKSKTQIKK